MNEIIRLRDGAVEWREIEGEIVALDRANAEYVAVNRTGTAIWPLLVAGATCQQLSECLAERFDVDPDAARRDVDAFVSELRERGLVDG